MFVCYFHVKKESERVNEKPYTKKFATADALFEELRTCGQVVAAVIDTADMGACFTFPERAGEEIQKAQRQCDLLLPGDQMRGWNVQQVMSISAGWRFVLQSITFTKRTPEEEAQARAQLEAQQRAMQQANGMPRSPVPPLVFK